MNGHTYKYKHDRLMRSIQNLKSVSLMFNYSLSIHILSILQSESLNYVKVAYDIPIYIYIYILNILDKLSKILVTWLFFRRQFVNESRISNILLC